MLLKRIISCLVFFLVFNSNAQEDNIHYNDLFQPDERITVSLHHNRIIGLGSQYFGVGIQNNTTCKLRVELEYIATLTCGQVVTGKIGFGDGLTINAGEKLKPEGFWDTNNTTIDVGNSRNSDCLNSANRSKEVEGGGYTAIEQVSFNIIEIENLCEAGQTISSGSNTVSNNNSSSSNSNSTDGSSTSTNDNTSGVAEICPVQTYSLKNITSTTCEFIWLSSATNSIAADGSLIQQGHYSDQFQFEYRRTDESNWSTVDVGGYQFNFVIQNLSPGTSYQSRLRRVCDEYNNKFSPWRNVNFKTAGSNSTNVGTSSTNNTTSTTNTNSTNTDNTAVNNDNSSSNTNSTTGGSVICPVQPYSLTNITSTTCEFLWLTTPTTIVAADGSISQQGNYSDQFQFEYKKTDELNWSTVDVSGYQMKFFIQFLSPGTSYQSRLRRVCDEYNNEFSPWRNLNFKTAN